MSKKNGKKKNEKKKNINRYSSYRLSDKEYKRKKRARRLHEGIEDIPLGVCIFMIVLGVVIGSVMVVGTWYWGELIGRDEAIPISANYETYELEYGRYGSVSGVELIFTDREPLYINAECYRVSVQDSLDDLDKGDRLDMLRHPNSDDVWEIKRGEDVILSFDESVERVRAGNIGFTLIGVFGYLVAALGITSLAVQYVRKRKLDNDKKNRCGGEKE